MNLLRPVTKFPWKVFSRTMAIQALLLCISLAALGLSARHFFKRQFTAQIRQQLSDTLHVLVGTLPEKPTDEWCVTHTNQSSLRVNVISMIDGRVLCDSHYRSAELDRSRLNRPEVISAIQDGFGENIRSSQALNSETIYGALRIPGRNQVLRVGVPLERLTSTLRKFDRSLALVLLTIALTAVGVLVLAARRTLLPVGKLVADLTQSLDHLKRDREIETSEQAALMSSISDAVFAAAPDKSALFFNSRFAMLFSAEEVFSRDEIASAYEQVFKTGLSATAQLESKAAQALRYYSVSVSPLRDPENKIYGALGIFHDISEIKAAEQLRAEFVANASHELRTPLTSIKGFADTLLLHQGQGKPTEPSFVEAIARNANRLLGLINHLLELSTLDAGVEQIHKTEIETHELTARLIKQLEPLLATKKQTIKIECVAKTVYADASRLEQVMINLIENASKYSQTESHILVRWDNVGDQSVALTVRDNGPGIAPEHHARLFERFYRVDKARSRKVGGSGLGLSIVKHIIQSHGGQISVESVLGQGTTFRCELPVFRPS